MGNVRNRGRKSARKKRPQEVIEEEKEKKRIDMMNRRLSLENNPNPIIEDMAVHPINPTQEEIPHSLEGPSQDEAHEEAVYMEPTVEEENINRTIDEDVGLPPSNYQEDSEGQQVATETPERIVDALEDRNPTPLPPLESTRRRTLKRIQVDEGLLNSMQGMLSKCSIAYQTQHILNKYFEGKCDGDKCRLFLSLLKSRSVTIVRKSLGIKMIKPYGPCSHIVKSLVDAFGKIGKNTQSKDHNAARRVLSQEIVNKNTRVLGFLKPTSKLVNLNVKTLRRYSIRREHFDTTGQIEFWAFIG